MIRLNYFLRRLPSLSLEAFQEYWREKHAVLLTKHASALRVRRYVQAHALPDDPLGEMMQQIYGTGGEPYDGVAELWWKSPQDHGGSAAELPRDKQGPKNCLRTNAIS